MALTLEEFKEEKKKQIKDNASRFAEFGLLDLATMSLGYIDELDQDQEQWEMLFNIETDLEKDFLKNWD